MHKTARAMVTVLLGLTAVLLRPWAWPPIPGSR
jgi:hypothetical protein